ncbi:MAG: hypothetical protein IPI93_10395 [Sphingobacteriaceae bacterium]|nr:hypothetical protein [Sphingobacteriaceae bacterium]
MVIINFSYNNQDFLKTIKDLIGKYDVLDVTGVLPKGSTIINVKALDPQLIILRNTVKDMIDAIGDVSLVGINKTTQIRDIEWNGLNLFWQTSISEKYPTRSFLTDLFYLKNIIKKGLVSLAKKKILVILPSVYSAVYCTSIRNYLIQKCLAAEVDFNYQLKKHYFAGPRTFFKKIRMGLDQSMKFRKKLKDIRTNTKDLNLITMLLPHVRVLGKKITKRIGYWEKYITIVSDLAVPIYLISTILRRTSIGQVNGTILI